MTVRTSLYTKTAEHGTILLTVDVNTNADRVLDIVFPTDKLADEYNDLNVLIQRYGPDNGRRIRRRLDDLRAAENLAVMRSLPGRCHELKGDMAGQLAIDVRHPFRLIFEPAHDPIPRKDDGGLDWSHVTAVRILRVEDYHG